MSLADRSRRITDWMQHRLVPELRYSQDHFEGFLRDRTRGVQTWLDLGCGHQLLPDWRLEAEREMVTQVPVVVGIDYDMESLRKHRSLRTVARADARSLPFSSDTFDLVTANMVVEHLDDPTRQFAEIGRVLKPGGRFVFHTPNSLSYDVRIARLLPDSLKQHLARILEGRQESDVFPTHYRANSLEDITRVATAAGLDLESAVFVSTLPVFASVPPLALAELLALRVLRRDSLAPYRSNIMCALRKRSV
ncbi:MAG: class I SAM-dependent methyltransferase [Gemmatimonadota bacterium]